MPSAPLNEHPDLEAAAAAAAASPNPDLETAAQPAVAASRNPQQTAAAASPEPNLETVAQPAAAANMHRVTGTFADPSHESTFSAGLFRMACPTHVLLMALVLPYTASAVRSWSLTCEPRVLLHTGRQRPRGPWSWIVLWN